jgi:serine/threonine protein kinase
LLISKALGKGIADIAYVSRRIDSERIMYSHPLLMDYARSFGRLEQRGGRGHKRKDQCPQPIGEGKDGSYVFVPHIACIMDMYPDGTKMCESMYKSKGVCGSIGETVKRHMTKSLLYKINKSYMDTIDEILSNKRVYEWLSHKHFLNYSHLHPTTCSVEVKDSRNNVIGNPLVVLRRMDGDAEGIPPKTINDVFELIKAVLIVIHVMHDHKFLHLDIKPKNILVLTNTTTNKYEYALGDFGIIDSYNAVTKWINNGDYSGTKGFMSPLILDGGDEESNDVYPIFMKFSTYSRFELDALFEDEKYKMSKDISRMSKIDLQSLGFTIYDLVKMRDDMLRVFGKFISKLLFFEKDGDFMTAYHALAELCTLRDVQGGCHDVGFAKS